MKAARFLANVPAELRSIPRPIALGILKALHRYMETGQGSIGPPFPLARNILLLRM